MIGGAGNQTAPSLANGFVAYLDDASGFAEVMLAPLAGGQPRCVTQEKIDHAWPRLGSAALAWRNPGSVAVVPLMGPVTCPAAPQLIAAPGTGRVALGGSFVAWEQLESNGTIVLWQALASGVPVGAPVPVAGSGRQGGIAAVNEWLAWIDFSAGVVHLVDTSGVQPEIFVDPAKLGLSGLGAVTEVAVDAATLSGVPGLAVAMFDGTTTRIAVLGSTGKVTATLDYAGEKVNPHLYGEWVGFEDLALTVPQVVLWHWSDLSSGKPALFLPSTSATEQRLHDLSTTGNTIDVVWAQLTASAGFDILHYFSDLPIGGVTKPPVQPATCDDADPYVEFTAERLTGKPVPYGTKFPLAGDANLLVCLDATDVTAGWVAVGSGVVAAPGDFGRGLVKREVRLAVSAGNGSIGAVLAGKPGASLHARIFLDAGGKADVSAAASTCAATGGCPSAPTGLSRPAATSGCATSGGPAPLALLLVPAALLLAPRRRARR